MVVKSILYNTELLQAAALTLNPNEATDFCFQDSRIFNRAVISIACKTLWMVHILVPNFCIPHVYVWFSTGFVFYILLPPFIWNPSSHIYTSSHQHTKMLPASIIKCGTSTFTLESFSYQQQLTVYLLKSLGYKVQLDDFKLLLGMKLNTGVFLSFGFFLTYAKIYDFPPLQLFAEPQPRTMTVNQWHSKLRNQS